MATEIIEHVAHPDKFIFNLSQLVKPNGYLLITTPLGSYFKNKLPRFSEFSNPEIFEKKQFGPNSDDHIFLLHMDELEDIGNQAGLKVVKKNFHTNPLTNGHIKLETLLKIIPKSFVFKIEELTQKLPGGIGKKIHNNLSILFQKKY